MASATSKTMQHKVVPQANWINARKELLTKEKQFTRLRDEISRQRRELPWEKIEKKYVFDGPKGKETLGDLFGGRSQLIVYHFMLGPGWKEGCPSCSFLADHFNPSVVHLAARDVAFAAVSRAPLAEIEAFQKRMGWQFKWVSSFGSDFNFDYQVSASKDELAKGKVYYNYAETQFPSEERPGASVFFKNEAGEIFHTYSTYGRGLDILIGAYNWIDLTPKGRDEDGLPHGMAWVRHHDKYVDSTIQGTKQVSSQEEKKKPAKILEPVLNEFREEVATTRRVLERVPDGKLAWKPHQKSMSLGQLALHVASVPGSFAKIIRQDELSVDPATFNFPAPKHVSEIESAFEEGVQAAEGYLNSVSENEVLGSWILKSNGKQIFARPRIEVIRMIMLNHWYHHRGQLSVYLRLLDVPVPTIYGPSADENPFG